MVTRKSQTATEYLVITAVVIIIALIVLGILGGIPGLGGGVSEQTARLALSTEKIGISDYGVTDYETIFTLQNNHGAFVEIDAITFDGKTCEFFYGTNPKLNIGKSIQVSCPGVVELEETSISWPVVINWTDRKTGAQYSQEGRELLLIGDVGSKYLATLQNNQYWNGTSGCWDASEDPAPICTCLDLARINDNATTLTLSYKLENSIDFDRCAETFGGVAVDYATNFTPIGTSINPFSGEFDGGSNQIKGLTIDAGTIADDIGLFGYTENNVNISNLGVVDATIYGDEGVGIIVGYGRDSNRFTRVFATGTIYSDYRNGGGIIGRIGADVTIESSFFSGNVTATSGYAGGLIGYMRYGEITNSYTRGTVSSPSDRVGGLVGFIRDDVTYIYNTYSTADVSGRGDVGGLIGNFESTDSIVSNSYTTGDVSGTQDEVGGLVGYNYGRDNLFIDSFATGDVSGRDEVGGLIGHLAYSNVTNSYATGFVTGVTNVGGLVGLTSYSTSYITDSFARGDVNGSTAVGGLLGRGDRLYITNSYSLGSVSATTNTGGSIGSLTSTVFLSGVSWENTSFNPDECVGYNITSAQSDYTPSGCTVR